MKIEEFTKYHALVWTVDNCTFINIIQKTNNNRQTDFVTIFDHGIPSHEWMDCGDSNNGMLEWINDLVTAAEEWELLTEDECKRELFLRML